MAAPDAILKLIELFDRNRDAYLSGVYKEAQLRHEFIDPFFKALGWDVYNESGYAEAYKDVIYVICSSINRATAFYPSRRAGYPPSPASSPTASVTLRSRSNDPCEPGSTAFPATESLTAINSGSGAVATVSRSQGRKASTTSLCLIFCFRNGSSSPDSLRTIR